MIGRQPSSLSSTSVAESFSPRRATSCSAFVDHLGIPVAHSLMGKGALSDDHPLVLGMTGFWGTALTNETCWRPTAVLAIGTRFKEADSSSWYRGLHLRHPAGPSSPTSTSSRARSGAISPPRSVQ